MPFDDEDKDLLLLNSLSRSFKNFEDAFLDGKKYNITLQNVRSNIRINDLTKIKELKVDDRGEYLNVLRGGMRVRKTKRGVNICLSSNPISLTSLNITISFLIKIVTLRRIVLRWGVE